MIFDGIVPWPVDEWIVSTQSQKMKIQNPINDDAISRQNYSIVMSTTCLRVPIPSCEVDSRILFVRIFL